MKKDEILLYLIQCCPSNFSEDLSSCTTMGVMKHFNMKTNAANYQLNELHKSHNLVKINTKPVYYLPMAVIKKVLGNYPGATTYQDITELMKEQKQHDELDKIIGSDGSLEEILRECRVAISYPDGGLPILLNGPTGSGKTFLAKKIFEYGVSKEIFSADAPFHIFNCAEYADNPELLSSKLFGYLKGAFTGAERDTPGLLESCDRGMLLIDEVHRLSPENQEKLFLFMDEGIFRRVGENSGSRKASVFLIFATTEDIHSKLLPTFLRRIPIVTHIPGLDDRGIVEKEAFIFYFFTEEAKRMHRELDIETSIIQYLSKSLVRTNVGGLENTIKHICANAYLGQRSDNKPVQIRYRNIPDDGSSLKIPVDLPEQRSEWIRINPHRSIENPVNIKKREEYIHFYEKITCSYQEFLKKGKSKQIYEEEMYRDVTKFLDLHKIDNDKNTLYRSLVQTSIHSLVMIAEDYKLEVDSQCFDILSAYTARLLASTPRDRLTNNVDLNSIKVNFGFNEELCESYIKVMESLNWRHSVAFSDFDQLVITSIFAYFNDQQISTNVKGLIVAHGFSSASSMASTVNRFIGENIFRSFNMPMEITFKEIGEMLRHYLSKTDTRDGVIILLDIGHVKDVYKETSSVVIGDIGVIDNVSMKMALDVGTRILNKQSVAKIMNETSKESYANFAYYPTLKEKVRALIITCQTGIGTAVKIKKLIDKCLPENIELNVIALDYVRLHKDKEFANVFRRYEVIGIIGTVNPKVENVTFIGLEELMSIDGANRLKGLFRNFLSADEIQNLNNKLLRSLSLENVINMLTILNPEKTLQLIEQMIKNWERDFSIALPNDLIMGLYVHLSSMIERVITRNAIESHEELDEFVRQHELFIEKMNQEFVVIVDDYHTKVPVSEIAYIYDLFRLKMPNFQY